MTKSKTKLLVGIGIVILLIDIFIMKYWVSNIKPDPFMSQGVEFYRLEIFGINILIGIFAFFIKKRSSILFFVNAIICYWIFSFFWTSWLENHPYSQTNYSFKIENRDFRLDISENPNTYGIYELNPNPTDSLKIIEIGMIELKGDSIILKGWDYDKWQGFDMYYYNKTLIDFPERPSEIELNKIE